ncbi:hypothetical protein PAXINDRAFT_165369 [Paxillus involutus ATCC 200175]|nr:hypothetical protein PAXINDRAFT_165369 [Paxillus involutus ATCC 200175]
MATQFKLTKASGLTRRITFTMRPSWSLLCNRIGTLYDIGTQNVGVSYVDSDGDEVTLSSDEELQDFYRSIPIGGKDTIKFTVHDLSTLRTADVASARHQTATPQQSHFRNTFGGHEAMPLVFEVEDEWQRLPGSLGDLFLSRDAPESPHAFLEVLESDINASKHSETDESTAGYVSRSDHTFTPTATGYKNKGKGRAATVEDDVSSAGSVIGDEAPSKPPVHVYDMSDTEDIFGCSPRSDARLPRSGAATPAQAQSTPVISEQALKPTVLNAAEEPKSPYNDDPPLPSLDLPDPDRATASLTHDVATFLTTISAVIASHPELSEGIRNIVSNASNGTYWATHRDAISRAAETLQRTAVQETGRTLEDLRRTTEEEAGARVADALGRVFRAIGEASHANRGDATPPTSRNATPPTSRNATQPPTTEAAHGEPRPLPNPAPLSPRFQHLPHAHRHHSWFGQPPFLPPGGPFWGGFAHPPPPPPPPPPVLPFVPRGWPRPPPPRFYGRRTSDPESTSSDREARAPAAEVRAHAAEGRPQATRADTGGFNDIIFGNFEEATVQETQPPIIVQQPLAATRPTPEELRADVERAKADYKARKEQYRQAKAIRKMTEQRQRGQESSTESPNISRQTSDDPTPRGTGPIENNVGTSSNNLSPIPVPEPPATGLTTPVPPEPVTVPEFHIVSNARGPYPQLEMFSVPRRSHTTGHMHRGHAHGAHESRDNRALNRIMRKLSDMGFTEGTYPNLSGKVMDQLLVHPPITKDAEDDIVTTMIEELIPTTSVVTPGNSSRDIPGAWADL